MKKSTNKNNLAKKLRTIADEEFYFGKKGYSPAGKALNEVADELSRQSSEGERLQAVYEVVSTLSHICGGRDCIGYRLPGDSATQYRCNLCSAMRKAMGIGSVSEEQCQHELHAPYCGRFSHLILVCKICGEPE